MSGGGPVRPPSPPPPLSRRGGDTAPVPNRTKICGENAVCLFVSGQPHRHLNTSYLK